MVSMFLHFLTAAQGLTLAATIQSISALMSVRTEVEMCGIFCQNVPTCPENVRVERSLQLKSEQFLYMRCSAGRYYVERKAENNKTKRYK